MNAIIYTDHGGFQPLPILRMVTVGASIAALVVRRRDCPDHVTTAFAYEDGDVELTLWADGIEPPGWAMMDGHTSAYRPLAVSHLPMSDDAVRQVLRAMIAAGMVHPDPR